MHLLQIYKTPTFVERKAEEEEMQFWQQLVCYFLFGADSVPKWLSVMLMSCFGRGIIFPNLLKTSWLIF